MPDIEKPNTTADDLRKMSAVELTQAERSWELYMKQHARNDRQQQVTDRQTREAALTPEVRQAESEARSAHLKTLSPAELDRQEAKFLRELRR